MARLVCFSDTHELKLTLPSAKYAIFAGDYQAGNGSNGHDRDTAWKFIRWYSRQPIQYKGILPGNHDEWFWQNPQDWTYMAHIYGLVPLNSLPGTWALNRLGRLPIVSTHLGYVSSKDRVAAPVALDLMRVHEVLAGRDGRLNQIDRPVFVTHCPPHGILDFEPGKIENCGPAWLRQLVEHYRPGLHVFGHIHDGYGRMGRFVNAAHMSPYGDKRPPNPPIIIPSVDHLETNI